MLRSLAVGISSEPRRASNDGTTLGVRRYGRMEMGAFGIPKKKHLYVAHQESIQSTCQTPNLPFSTLHLLTWCNGPIPGSPKIIVWSLGLWSTPIQWSNGLWLPGPCKCGMPLWPAKSRRGCHPTLFWSPRPHSELEFQRTMKQVKKISWNEHVSYTNVDSMHTYIYIHIYVQYKYIYIRVACITVWHYNIA